MSSIIKFDLKELRQLANDKNSCVIEKKVTQNLALQPWCLGNLKESIKNLLDYKIGKFDKEFNGILLSYKNLRILQNVGAIRNDNADIHFQVQADYFIFQPYVGATLKGVVNKKSTTHLGILVHRVFNVVIPRPTEEPGNAWIGSSIQENQEIIFKIIVLDLYGALPYIRGELDERWIKLGQEGDDETIEPHFTKSIEISYVNFDKTKPCPPIIKSKQMSDKLDSAAKKSNGRNKYMTKKASEVNNPAHNEQFAGEKETILTKIKNKRHKVSDSEVKQDDGNPRIHKKHKRDS